MASKSLELPFPSSTSADQSAASGHSRPPSRDRRQTGFETSAAASSVWYRTGRLRSRPTNRGSRVNSSGSESASGPNRPVVCTSWCLAAAAVAAAEAADAVGDAGGGG